MFFMETWGSRAYGRMDTWQSYPVSASGDTSDTLSATAKLTAHQRRRQPGKESAENSTDMSRLSAKVDSDMTKGGASREAFAGYLKACGALVVSAAIAMSVLAQVRMRRRRGVSRGARMCWEPSFLSFARPGEGADSGCDRRCVI